MEFNNYIDHTLLAPEATEEQIERIVKEAMDNNFHTVMINPYWVEKVHLLLKGSSVKTACVIGFPSGPTPPKSRLLKLQMPLRMVLMSWTWS